MNIKKVKPNIRVIDGAKGESYYVSKRIEGNEYRKAFKTLEEAEEYIEQLETVGKRKNFDYPTDVIRLFFGDNEKVDIKYIEENFDTNFQLVLDTLTEREARLFQKMWKDGYTLEAIGKQEGITKERVRQICNKAERKIKYFPARSNVLRYGKEVKELQDDINKLVNKLILEKEKLIYQLNNPETIEITVDEVIEKRGIETLEFSVRTCRCLKRAGINTIYELTQKTEEEIIKIRNLGRKCLKEIKQQLQELGLKLKEEMEDGEYLE